MDAIKLSVEIHENRRLIIDLPPDTPLGTAQITIQPAEKSGTHPSAIIANPAREATRAKLAAAGFLSTMTYPEIPADFVRLPDEELLKLTKLPPGAPSIDQIIDEDRGPR